MAERGSGGKVTPLDPYQTAAPARAGTLAQGPGGWFGPLEPQRPSAPPEVAGRGFDFPAGFNLNIEPRAYEPIKFADLRALADSYDLLRLVIETRKDQMARLSWNIKPRGDLPAGSGRGARLARIREIEAFLRRPDGVHFWETWLRILLEDLFVIDAPTLYLRRSRGGALSAIEPIDGATIKRVIDDWGRTPAPPAPAYQQVLHGLPAVDYTRRDLLYAPRNIRAHKVYGFSPVEQVMMTVNIALRRQIHQLQYFTEGNVPEALIGVPETWTPDQIRSFQEWWDAILEGNTGARRHAKFVPGGVAKTFIPTREIELKSAFDEWLARVVCFAFSVSPQAFSDRMNRATAETAQEVALTEGLAPIQNWVKQLVDHLLLTELDAPDLEFSWQDDRVPDPHVQADVLTAYVKAGILSVNEARSRLGQDPVKAGDVPMVLIGSGYVPLGGGAEPDAGKGRKDDNATVLAVAKYTPGQPRVPAGEPDGGQWTSRSSSMNPRAVRAISDGVVTHVGMKNPDDPEAGSMIHIRGLDGATYVYGHLDASTVPDVGTSVARGDFLGDIAGPYPDRENFAGASAVSRQVADSGIQVEPLAPPNIPGTDIPDRGIPEDLSGQAMRRARDPSPHENEDRAIEVAPSNKEKDQAILRPFLPQDQDPSLRTQPLPTPIWPI